MRKLGSTTFLLASCISLVSFNSPTYAQKTEAKKNDFIRVTRDATGTPAALQTAIRSYRSRTGSGELQLDLVGAVHIGDKSYYRQLNKQFESYDVVLYELVAPTGTVIPKGGRKSGGNPISAMQGMMKNMLRLSSQVEEVDYTKSNFVHADMSPAQMTESMKKRGDTPMTVALSAMAEMMRQANLKQLEPEAIPAAEFSENPLALMFDEDRDVKLKLMMAEQFSAMGTDAFGQTVNQLLIADRNAAAMNVFQKELAKGHKRIAIFYGAAHLPDFEERLKEFDLVRAKTTWLTAWNLNEPKKKITKAPNALDRLMRTLLSPPVQ